MRQEGGYIKMIQNLFLKKRAWENTVYIMTTTLFKMHRKIQGENTTRAFKPTGLAQRLGQLSPSARGGRSMRARWQR